MYVNPFVFLCSYDPHVYGFTWDVGYADLAQSWWHCGEVTAAMMAGVGVREASKVGFMKRRDAYKTGKPIYSTKSKAQ